MIIVHKNRVCGICCIGTEIPFIQITKSIAVRIGVGRITTVQIFQSIGKRITVSVVRRIITGRIKTFLDFPGVRHTIAVRIRFSRIGIINIQLVRIL